MFVECKNWSRPVDSSEARDFEVKLQNHRSLVKVGIFVAFGGVTDEFVTEVKRASRSDYHLTLIESDDIARFGCSVSWRSADSCTPTHTARSSGRSTDSSVAANR